MPTATVCRRTARKLKLYRLAANQGDSDAQNNLGFLYAHGQGVPQDYKEAVQVLPPRGRQGNPNAQCNLGLLYNQGHGVAQDHKEAAKWYRLAAAQGNARKV